jgi:hypothetical protein
MRSRPRIVHPAREVPDLTSEVSNPCTARVPRRASVLRRSRGAAYAGFMRKRSGAVVCPGCGRLVDVNDAVCPYCGRTSPGMFGYGPWLQRLLGGFDLSLAVIGGCVVLYVLALIIDPAASSAWRACSTSSRPRAGRSPCSG